MKGYDDIVGDGGSTVPEQIAGSRAGDRCGLAGIRHLVAVGSGKGGVGKSTSTRHSPALCAPRGLRIGILDADLNGPCQARMAGVQGGGVRPAAFAQGRGGLQSPAGEPRCREAQSIAVVSIRLACLPESGVARRGERDSRRVTHVWGRPASCPPRRAPPAPSIRGRSIPAPGRFAAGRRTAHCPCRRRLLSGRGPRSCWWLHPA